jgi:hypothetical protein
MNMIAKDYDSNKSCLRALIMNNSTCLNVRYARGFLGYVPRAGGMTRAGM